VHVCGRLSDYRGRDIYQERVVPNRPDDNLCQLGRSDGHELYGGFWTTTAKAREYIYIAIGSIMVMFVAQALFFFGVQISNMTTMALTLLAFPFISLILELVLGRIKVSSLGVYDLIGFVPIAAGYVVYISKPQP